MQFQEFFRVEQKFDSRCIQDVPEAVRQEFDRLGLNDQIAPGQTVAVGVGSRGVHNLPELVRTSVECLKALSLEPFITPAMGSHGGATAEGQIEILAHLGITESAMGVPIKASMDVVSLGRIDAGPEVFIAKDVLTADHIMVINRIKPHTLFTSKVESGLCKMVGIGLGRQAGASNLHQYDLAKVIVPAARLILEKLPFLCGLAVTESAMGGTYNIRLTTADQFVQTDSDLLEEAYRLLPRLPMDELDLLIVDRMGKEVSGAGMDPNVIGSWRRDGGERKPDYKTIVVLDLTDASHGNATGMGAADIIPKRMQEKIDFQATYKNALTAKCPRAGRMPMIADDDRAAIEAAVSLNPDSSSAKIVRILDTCSLDTFWATRPVVEALNGKAGISVGQQALKLAFDDQNRILPFGN
ncbi:lactate racemase domain-containing protein [uncultured Desulfosarcina sp.]|uniref:lactate racemase domain-containing protein n=1 Tax=uncultured Desulfosarcina sp. TaxID=218289 RepID=UPI0029C944D0|nr:lactate racemase domain-containing protein [uncultured Desulfosarcina sp.]